QISKKIQLCSCTDSPETLKTKSRWSVRRIIQGFEKTLIIGQLTSLEETLKRIQSENYMELCQRINEKDSFDFETEWQEDDQLILTFVQQPKNLLFEFKYKENRWQITDFNPFGLNGKYQKYKHGTIKNLDPF
ncbi:MAG: hypothetical protein KJ941_08495, partial [Bacteroidetes bacterium]|nr:hypothetical protein [Bacteroidota bacterium]